MVQPPALHHGASGPRGPGSRAGDTGPTAARGCHEAYVSAPSHQASPDARFPRPDEHGRGSRGPLPASAQGPEAAGPHHAEQAPLTSVPSEGFPRSSRLLRRPDFRRVQHGGTRRVSEHLVVLWQETGQPSARFGLTVSRKVGNAVARNRVKRWLREAIRRQRHGLTGVDVVLIARSNAADAGFDALYGEVGRHLRALKEQRS